MSKDTIFNMQIELNDICNLECKHCYQVRSKVKDELDIDIVLEQYEEIKKETGYKHHLFRLSGGEVTLRKDLFNIVRKITNKGYYVEIITNGVLIDLPYAFSLKASGVMFAQVSMDGSDAKTHDFIRGKGAFEKTIKGIKNLQKAGIPVEIKFTMIKGVNSTDFINMFNLCYELDIKYLSIGRFIFAGSGKNLKEGNFIGHDLKDAFYKIINIGREFPDLRIRIRDQLARIISDIEIPENVNASQNPYIGVNYLALDTYGNIYADRQLDIVLGNIHKKTLHQVWTKSRKLKQLKGGMKYLKGKCIDCSINRLCLGGNKTAAYGITGNPFEPDPGCWMYEPEPNKVLK